MDELIRLDSTGVRDAMGRFARMDAQLEAAQRRRVQAAAQTWRDQIKEEAPRSAGEGPHMADGIVYRTRIVGPGVIEASIQATGPHAWLVHLIRFGTKPHIIRAKKKSLRFFWAAGPRGAGVYFYKQVRHPGTRPNDFVGRAFMMRRDVLDDLSRTAGQIEAGYSG